jgi:hypothetical protein
MNRRTRAGAFVALVALAACDTPVVQPELDGPDLAVAPSRAVQGDGLEPIVPGDGDLQSFVDRANVALAARGVGISIAKAEWLDTGLDTDASKVVFADDRELRLDTRWVPRDARRVAGGLDLTQGSFPFFQVANGAIPTEAIVDRAFDTWNAVRCSKLQVDKTGIPFGVFPSAILSFPGFANDPFAADISTIGWLPGFLFDAVLGPGASASVLGVAFTFTFVDPVTRERTDVDGDGRGDTALKEIWYNDDFAWSTDGPGIDLETVILHENGHALELGHFGKLTAFFNRDGSLKRIQASPRAVMNASYIGPVRAPRGTDKASMCGNFASWR